MIVSFSPPTHLTSPLLVSLLSQDMVAVSAECASVMPTTPGVPVTVPWSGPPVWPGMDRSAMAKGPVTVVSAGAPTPGSRAPPVRSVPPALVCARRTSEFSYPGRLAFTAKIPFY